MYHSHRDGSGIIAMDPTDADNGTVPTPPADVPDTSLNLGEEGSLDRAAKHRLTALPTFQIDADTKEGIEAQVEEHYTAHQGFYWP